MAFKQQGTGFTGVNDIVNANQNNQLGSTIESGVQKDVNDVNQQTQQAQSQFNTDVNNANLNTSQNQQKVTDTLNNAVNNPSQVSAGDVNSFDTFRQGGYSGPTQLNNYSSLQQQGQKVSQLGNDVNNQGGQYDLLKQYVGGNQNYNQGEQNLDSLILGQTGQPQLQQVKQITQPVMNNIQQAGTQAGLQANAVQQGNQAFAQNVNNQISSNQQTVNNSIAQQLAQYQQQDNANRNAYLAALKTATGDVGTNDSAPSATPITGTPAAPTVPSSLSGLQALVNQGLLSQDQFNLINTDTSNLNNVLYQNGPAQTQNLGSGYENYNPDIGKKSISYYAGQGNTQAVNDLNQYNLGTLLSQDLQYNNAQNLDTAGVTNANQAAQLNALASLAGTGQNYTAGQYKQGNVGFIPGTTSTDPNATAAPADQALVNQIAQAQADYNSEYAAAHPAPIVKPGMGGGGTVICTELNRQGLLDDKMLALDAEFGKKYKEEHLDAYLGYILLATPVVGMMKKSQNLTRVIYIFALPWAKYMANQMDPENNQPSAFGQKIHETGTKALTVVYKVLKLLKVC